MTKVKKEINNAYLILSGMVVSGDLVDLVASAKMCLRNAHQILCDMETDTEEEKAEE